MNTIITSETFVSSRENFVLTSTEVFVNACAKGVTIDSLRDFADGAMERVQESEEEYIKYYIKK